jgi:hypothetical protein
VLAGLGVVGDLAQLPAPCLQLGQKLLDAMAVIAQLPFLKAGPVAGKQAKVETRFCYVNAHEVSFFHQTPIKEFGLGLMKRLGAYLSDTALSTLALGSNPVWNGL